MEFSIMRLHKMSGILHIVHFYAAFLFSLTHFFGVNYQSPTDS
jgi:hypothetical protein